MMKELISFELLKLKKQKSVYICAAIMIALLFINIITIYGMALLSDVFDETMTETEKDLFFSMFSLNVVSSVLTAAANGSYTIIVGIVTVLFVCSDYAQGTIKNVIARGGSRERVYLAKLIAVTIIAVALYITVILFGFLFGVILFGFDAPDSARWLGVLAVQFLAALGTAYLSFFAASAIRKVGPSILVIILVPSVVELLLTLIDLFAETHISDYFITTVFNFLSTSDVELSRVISSLITTFAYTAGFIGGGYLLSRKSEY